MRYIITFLEGIIAFISPCHLPLIPVYICYFAGGGSERDTKKTIQSALGFIVGFTLVFIALGAFAGLLGGLLRQFETAVNIVTGAIVVLFGLHYIGIINIKFLSMARAGKSEKISGFFSAVIFGIVFSIGWTPCVGMFLGSALMLASQQASAIQGTLMLLCFSLGMGIPFFICAILIDKLKKTFDWIKKHYKVINIVSGVFLIVVGILMMTGMMQKFLNLFTW